jgi:hypothetical protein
MISLNFITDCCAFYYCHIDILILIIHRCLCCPYRCCHETGRQNTHGLNILTNFFVLLDLNSHFQFPTFYWNGQRTDSKLRYVSFLFYQKPSLRNCFRRFRTKLSLQERIVSYLNHFRKNLSFTYINNFGKNLLWEIV